MLTETKSIAPPKRLLYGPGPSMAEPRVYEAMAGSLVGIRDPYFLELIQEIRAGLRQAFGTRNEMTFVVPASGSGAMEAAMANFVLPGSKVAIFAAGHFADRITATALGRSLRCRGSGAVYRTRAAAGGGVRTGGDLHRSLSIGPDHRLRRTPGGCAGDCRHGDLARRHAGGDGRGRH